MHRMAQISFATFRIFLRVGHAPVASNSFALSTIVVYLRKMRVAIVWKARWIVVKACTFRDDEQDSGSGPSAASEFALNWSCNARQDA